MHEPATVDKLDDVLEILGQQPIPIYTQICLCYSVANASSHPAVVETLRNGLKRLSASFPWVTGQVVNEGACEGKAGIFKIKPLEDTPRLVVRDLRDDPSIPSMDVLQRATFPISMLDEAVLCPRKTVGGGNPDDSEPDSTPVFLLQVNFISGGLLLTFLGQHQAMDGMGQGHIMHLLSKACSNEPFTSEELASGNLVRHSLIPLLDESWEQGSELDHQIAKPAPLPPVCDDADSHSALTLPPKCTWTTFAFDMSSLNVLKSVATKSIPPSFSYISTDDALSAFVWQSVIRSRLPRFDPTTESTFARAIDVRRYLDIPQTYPGLIENMTYNTYTFQKLIEQPLGVIASQLRSGVDPKISHLGYSTRALGTALSRASDKSVISITASIDLPTDIMLSSWAKLNCCELEFGFGLGKPEAVRRPLFDPCESLVYLLPKTLDGEIVIAICLRDEDLERLKADKDFTKHARHIG